MQHLVAFTGSEVQVKKKKKITVAFTGSEAQVKKKITVNLKS